MSGTDSLYVVAFLLNSLSCLFCHAVSHISLLNAILYLNFCDLLLFVVQYLLILCSLFGCCVGLLPLFWRYLLSFDFVIIDCCLYSLFAFCIC